jgi:DNA-binding NarL/FixJ family response regulator
MNDTGPRVLIVCDDLFFRVKLEEMIRQSGRVPDFIDPNTGLDDLPAAAQAFVVDLKLSAMPACDAIRSLRQRRPAIPVIAFGPHVEKDAITSAREAGAEYSLPRSRLVRELPDLLNALYSNPEIESGGSS